MASTKIRGITIKLAADYNDVIKSFKSIKSQAYQTQRTLTDIQKLLKENPNSKLLKGQEFKHLDKLIDETKSRIKELQNNLREKIKLADYDNDFHKYEQAIDGVNREIEHQQTLLKELENERAFKNEANDVKEATNNLDRMESKLSATRNLMAQLPKNSSVVNLSFKQTKEALIAAEQKAKALKNQITAMSKLDLTDKQQRELEELQNELVNTKARVVELYNEYKKHPTAIGNTFKTVGSSMQDAGNKISNAGMALAGFSAAMVVAGKQAYQMAQDIETSMQKVRSIVVANGDDLKLSYEDLYNGVYEASNETGVAVADFNEAVYQSISASVDAGKAIDFTTQAVKLARGGFTDTTKAVDILTTVVNAYSLTAEDADRISNNLLVTQNRGKTTVDLLAGSLGKVVPSAAIANVNFEQLAASMAVLTKNGIPTFIAGTAVRAMLDEMNKSGSRADKALRELTGSGFGALMKQGKTLTDVLHMLNGYAGESGKTLSDMFANVRSRMAAISLLTEDGKAYNEILKEMYTNQTACNDAFAIMDDTPAVKMQKSINKLKNTMSDLGRRMIPIIQKVADKLVSLADKFNSLDDSTKDTILNFAGIATAASPILIVFGKLYSGVGSVISTFGELHEKIAKFTRVSPLAAETMGELGLKGGSAASALMAFGPVGPAILATVGGLAAAWAILSRQDWYKEIRKQQEALKELKEETQRYTSELKDLANYNDDIGDSKARQAAARKLLDEYKNLENGTEKASVKQQKMTSILKQLNALYPELNLNINTGTQSIEEYINTAERSEKIQSINELLTESYKKMAEAEEQVARQQEYVNTLSKTTEDAWGVTIENEEYERAVINLENLKQAKEAAASATEQYENQLASLIDEQTAATDASAAMAGQMQNTANTVDGAVNTYSSATEQYNNLTETEKETMSTFVDAVGTMQTTLENTINNSMQLFAEWNGGANTAFADIVTNLNGQADNLRQWEQDMNTIFTAVSTETGNSLNVDMYNEILAAGPSNANAVRNIAQQIQDTGGTAIDDLNTAWANRADAMSLVGDTEGAQLLANSSEAIGKAMEGVNELFETSGEQTWQGFVIGMQSSINEASASAEEGAQEVIDTVTGASGFDTHSPSRVFDKIGMYCGMGLAQGMNKERPLVKAAAQNLAQAANLKSLASGLQASARYVGNMIGAGLAQGMNQQLGQVKRIAAEMMSTVTSTMQTKGKIESPSKVTKWQGQMLGDGLVIGMKDKMNEVARTAATMMDIPTTAAAMTNSNVNNLNQVNNTTINVSGAGNPNAVADAVMREIQKQMTRRSAVWA